MDRCTIKQQVIGAGFAFFKATRLHRGLSAFTQGHGAILMLHHVRPAVERAFAPNRLLEIEPAFLDAALTRVKALGFDLVAMDEVVRRVSERHAKPFVALTFDDGYRDTLVHALPILEKHGAPFALYVTTGFADRSARLWWVELEAAIAVLDRVALTVDDRRLAFSCLTADDKNAAFRTLYWMLRAEPEARLLGAIAELIAEAGVKSSELVADLCLDWSGIRAMAIHPLCTIGVHTLTHPMLAKHDDHVVRHELAESRRLIEMQTGLPARHLAYPVGDPTSAGLREFAIAAELGFSTAVTTRPGMIFSDHEAHATALPRLSLNGNWQDLDSLEVLLSGLPFAAWNRGRRVNVA